MCLIAVKRGFGLPHVHEQTYELCLEAVKKHGWSIENVNPQYLTLELCLAAVKQDIRALKFMKSHLHTPEVCLAAFNINSGALEYIKCENLKHILQKFDILPFDDEVLSFIQQNPQIENGFNDVQKKYYDDYCNTQLTKSCKD
jgi:hypothetical protein